MFRSKRLWWAVIVFLFSIQIPEKAHSIKIDPYQFKTLVGTVTFEYERVTQSYNNKSSPSYYSFSQYYTLDFKGFLFHPLLIIYDTGISYTKQSSGYADSKSGYDYKTYYFSTTFIRKSIIPLTLRGSKSISNNNETTSYGLTWEGRFRRLPYTRVVADKHISEGASSARESTNYRVNMKKGLGPSRNEFRYTLSEGENSTEGTASSTSAMDFSNRTKISENTDFYFGAARGVSTSDVSPRNTNEGIRANLSSSPSKEFSQRHRYSYSRNAKEDSTSESNSYSGSMRYRFSNRLASSLSVSTSSRSSDSLTTERQTDSLSTSGSLGYAVSRNLSLSEKIRYSKSQTSSSDAGQSNLADRTRLTVDTTARYRKKLSWANLGAGYSIGYLEEERAGDPLSGKALNQSFSLALGGMDALGYATVDASGGYNYLEPITGDISERDARFALRAQNKIWKKYLTLNGSHTRSERKSWLEADDSKSDQSSLSGSVLYFKTVSISFAASRTNNYNTFDEKFTTTSKRFSIGHNRRLYNGRLTTSMRYRDIISDFSDTSQRITEIIYIADYTKLLLRRIPWTASLHRTEQTTDGRLSVNTRLANVFIYQLRAWGLGAKHEYTLREYLNSRSSETRILLTASRVFVWRWL